MAETQLTEYKPSEIDVGLVLAAYQVYGAMVRIKPSPKTDHLRSQQMFDVSNMSPYTRLDKTTGIIVKVNGLNPRDLNEFYSVIIREKKTNV